MSGGVGCKNQQRRTGHHLDYDVQKHEARAIPEKVPQSISARMSKTEGLTPINRMGKQSTASVNNRAQRLMQNILTTG